MPRRLPYVVAVVAVAAVAGVLWSPLPQGVRSGVADTAVLSVVLLTALALGLRARSAPDRRRRRAWQLFAGGSLLAATGNVVLLLPTARYTGSVLVAVILAAITLSAAGALYYPVAPAGRLERGRILADGLVVGLSLLGILIGVVSAALPDLVGTGALWAVLVLPIADCVIVTVLIIMVLRSPPADYGRFYAAALGFLCIGVADTSYAVRGITSGTSITGEPTDLGWFVGYLGIAVAVLRPDRTRPGTRPDRTGGDRPMLATATVYACLAAAAVVLVVAPSGELVVLVRVLVVLTVVAVAFRELLITYDNLRLRRGLDQRVRQRTEQLRESAETSAAVAASIADGILTTDLGGRLTYVNTAAATVLGRSPADLVGQPLHRIHPDPPTDRPDPGSRPDPVAGTGRPGGTSAGRAVSTGGRSHLRHHDGSLVPVQLTLSPLVRGGQTRGSVVVFRDLRTVERVERMKAEFVSTVSHELRTPLTSIRGVLGLLGHGRLGTLTPRGGVLVQTAVDGVDRLTRLVEDLLDLGRLGAGRMPVAIGDVDAAAAVTRAVEQVQPLLVPRRVGVRLDLGSGPAPSVRADPDRLHQVLTNLLSNAAKFAPPGSEVRVGLHTSTGTAAPGGGASRTRFTVTDHGPGVPADMLEHIFDRFTQVDQSDTRSREGTGLGLAIARELVTAMAGTLSVVSTPDVRTTFTVDLPTRSPLAVPGAGPEARV